MTRVARIVGFWTLFLALLVFGESLEHSAANASSNSLIAAASYLSALLALDVILPVPSSMNSTMLGALLGVSLGTLVSAVSMTISCAIGYVIGAKLSGTDRRHWLPVSEIDRVKRLSERYGSGSSSSPGPFPCSPRPRQLSQVSAGCR